MARSGDRAARRRLPDGFPRLRRTVLWRAGHFSRSALSRAHEQSPVHRHLTGGDGRIHARAGLFGVAHQRPRAAAAGNFSSFAAPHGCYQCKGDDRWCVISVETQEEWIRLCEVVGRPELASDPRFADLCSRVENHKELDALVESWTTQHAPHQVMLILQREGIAAGAVQTAEDLYRDPHLRERGFARDVYLPQVGWVTRVGPSVRLNEARLSREEIVHTAGEDNEAVFGQLLGLSTEQIKAFTEREVLR